MTEKQSRKQTTTYANLQNDQSGQPQQGKPRKPSLHARWKTMSQAMGMEIREHKSSFAVYVVLRMLVLAMAILQFFNGNFMRTYFCASLRYCCCWHRHLSRCSSASSCLRCSKSSC